MHIASHINKPGQVLLFGCLLLDVLIGCSTYYHRERMPELHLYSPEISELSGVWMQAWSIKTVENVDEMLTAIEAGHFNAIFVNIFSQGYAYFESTILEKHPSLAPDYDPLAYVIEQAHRRGIAVHTWLVAGPVDYRDGPGPILVKHPDWAMIGPDGQQQLWLNYNRPDVRQFIGDLVLEILTNYNVDGVHFDYTRYPGPEWGFDSYSAQVFAQEYGTDLDLLRYSELPAYGTFQGNPLAGATTAQVLAAFDNGRPSVLLNSYGAGQVVVLNWNASERQVAVSSGILSRSIDYLLNKNGGVYILNSETNATQYGFKGFQKGVTWLKDLGISAAETAEKDLAALDGNDVLVMPNVYLINAQVASDLADFVHRGGGLIFVDGPSASIEDENIQAITGMRAKGGYFEETGLLVTVEEHNIIPSSERELALKDYEALDTQWKTFRKHGINKLLQEVYQRAKRQTPNVLITITVSADQEELADRHLLDWQAWLEGKYVDLIIPRAYVDQDESLVPIIADWQPIIEDSNRIVLGLKTYVRQNDEDISKTPERVLYEIARVHASGSRGVVLFDIEHASNAVLRALATGPFSSLGTGSD